MKLLILLCLISSVCSAQQLPIEPVLVKHHDGERERYWNLYIYYTRMDEYNDTLSKWYCAKAQKCLAIGKLDSGLIYADQAIKRNKDGAGYAADAANMMCIFLKKEAEYVEMSMAFKQLTDYPIDSTQLKNLQKNALLWDSIRTENYRIFNILNRK